MKRILLRLLTLLVGVAIFLGLLAWDLHRRTEAAFESHRRALAAEIARLRALHERQESPMRDWEPYREEMESLDTYHSVKHWPCRGIYAYLVPSCYVVRDALALNRSKVYFAYEAGPSRSRDLVDWYGTEDYRRGIPGPVRSWEFVFVSLGAVLDAFRGGGFDRATLRAKSAKAVFDDWRRDLEAGSYAAEDLAQAAGFLDRLRDVRPRLREVIAAEFAIERSAVASNLLMPTRGRRFVIAAPDWKSAFSWKVLLIRVLNRMERDQRVFQDLEKLPPTQRAAEIQRLEDLSDRDDSLRTESLIPYRIGDVFRQEEELEATWTLVRAATAVAWFRAERGRLPSTLAELAPKHLSRVPGNVTYDKGELKCAGSSWRVRN